VLWPLAHGEGAPTQGGWAVQIAGLGLAGALLQVRLDLPDRVIQTLE
jgi:hypothetical protein